MPDTITKIQVKQILRPTRAEINLSAFRYNLKKIRKIIGSNCKLMISIKANGYGHGAIPLARFAEKHKLADGFAVALIEEGVELKSAGIKLPILVLGSIYPFSSFETALKNDLSVTIAGTEAAKKISQTARKLNITAKCHIKVDTGLGRIGPRKPKAIKIVKYLSTQALVKIEGLYTHFADAEKDLQYTKLQLKHFKDTVKECQNQNIPIGFKHCDNSHAMIKYPQSHFDMVRPGLAVYGLVKGFKPVLSLKSKVVFLKHSRKGSSIGYGRLHKCTSPTHIATIPIGYGDGYPKALSDKGYILISGKKCKILGSVTMDMIMADVTHIKNIKIGREAVLIGAQGNMEITADDIAKTAKTISYEIVTSILPRVPRVYINEN